MPKLSLPPVLVFDAVGTLIHPEPPAAAVYADVGRRYGSRLSITDITARFVAAFAREEERDRQDGQRTSEARERRRWREIVASVLDDVSDPAACFAQLFDHFSRSSAWACAPNTGIILRDLAGEGRILALASNYDRRLRSVVRGLPELQPIEHVIISSEIGWRKPAPEFFAAVRDMVKRPPEQIIFIGDDPINDYDGARTAGLAALLYDPRGKATGATARIISLGELIGGQ